MIPVLVEFGFVNPSGGSNPSAQRLSRKLSGLPRETVSTNSSTLKAPVPALGQRRTEGCNSGGVGSQWSHLALPDLFINWILNSRS